MSSRHIQLYVTTDSPCGYYDDRISRNLVPDPNVPLNAPIYNRLIQHGFRRSGAHTYRPHCNNCQACIACRIPVNEAIISRSQKRCLKANRDINLTVAKAEYTDETFLLYQRYLNSRHVGGSMENPGKEDFQQFLFNDWCDTQFLEFRLDQKLIAVAVTDIVSNGISAVYSFFDPEMKQRSLGTFCILQQIEYAKTQQLDYVYLGYWIENHPKMHYKKNFKPLQLYLDERWQTADHHTTDSNGLKPDV